MTEQALTPPLQLHRCRHPRCNVVVAGGLFACSPHFTLLPVRLRERLWSTRHAVINGVAPPGVYEAAVRDAIAWWERRG